MLVQKQLGNSPTTFEECVIINPRHPWTKGAFSPLHATLVSFHGFKKLITTSDTILVASATAKVELSMKKIFTRNHDS